MSKTPLIEETNVVAVPVLNPLAAELIGFATQSLTAAVLAEGGDLDTLNIQVFPEKIEDVPHLRFNVTMNKLPDANV